MKIRRIVATLAASALAVSGLAACSNSGDSASGGPIRIGTTDETQKAWSVFEDKAKEEGYNIEIVPFGDYNPVNDALVQGQLDANQFQHLRFLAQYNQGSGEKLTPISSTAIYPLALFWKGHDSLDGIEGQKVAIPNDSTNQGRAIKLLAREGLVSLRNQSLLDPTPADIDKDASKVEVSPVDAAQSPISYGEGTPAIINNTWLDRAGIDPKDAIVEDDPNTPEAEPYINVFVTRAEDANREDLKALARLWHSPEIQEAMNEDSGGTAVPVDRPAEELQQILADLETQVQAAH